jgi:hypothetical protein
MPITQDVSAAERHYSLFQMGTKEGPTLLIIGGIHGDEPGGYFTPMLFSKHYRIEKGGVWVVPNLNFDSILRNRRGLYGDMNRKFLHIDPNDNDFQPVSDIKKLILSPEVDMVLNLHDGHGFYREEAIDEIFNPGAWGQTCIIDQQNLPGVKFGNLQEIAEKVNKETNIQLREDVHEFNVKNTHTYEKDEAMRQSLTYFAITNKKPAFAVETSKNITDLALKVFYQLKTIEEFLEIMGIRYQKDFDLNIEAIRALLSESGEIEIPEGKITLRLSDLRENINFFPAKRGQPLYSSDNPLVAVIGDGNLRKIMNGNIHITTLSCEFYEFNDNVKSTDFIIDNSYKTVSMGSTVNVTDFFEVVPVAGLRANIIGFVMEDQKNECGIKIMKKDIVPRFSIDKSERSFRVEFYRDGYFCGMVIIEFNK